LHEDHLDGEEDEDDDESRMTFGRNNIILKDRENKKNSKELNNESNSKSNIS